MNPRTKKLKTRPCVVCGYPFADKHHIFPRWGKVKKTVLLCPNHHRFANILQIMLKNKVSPEFLIEFAKANFDAEFNRVALAFLVEGYENSQLLALFNTFFGGEE